MRIRFLIVSFSAVLFGGGFAIQACGGTQSDSTPVDAGLDVADATVKDTNAPDVKDAAPACDTNADILKGIPDASIADGGSSVGICLGCASVKCKTQIDACKKDCACQGVAADALECYAKTQSLACAASFQSVPKATQQIGIALAGCVQGNCDNECQASTLTDAGTDADAN